MWHERGVPLYKVASIVLASILVFMAVVAVPLFVPRLLERVD